MNFKRLRGIAAAAFATLAAALLAGCMNPMAGSVDGDSNARMALLSLSATGIPNEYAEQVEKSYLEQQNSRSILPNAPYETGSTGLTFYLSGTSTTGKNLDDMKVELEPKSDDTNEKVYVFKGDVAISSMSWDLVLTAYTDGEAKQKPVLQGFCSIDLRNGSGTASFKLSPENLTTPGSVKITGKFLPKGNVASWTMGIYKMDITSNVINESSGTLQGNGTDAEEFTYEYNSITPGIYIYKMVFKNTAGIVTGSFLDTLVVYAGNALVQNLGTLDIINTEPDAPTNFTASLVNGSENPDGTYQVKLSWTSGGGETNFEIELTEYAKGEDGNLTAVADYPKIYGMESMDLGTTKDGVIDFRGSDVWAGKGNAMTYGEEEAYLKLKLGTLYDVRIRARNYVGVSKSTDAKGWVSRNAATEATGFTPYGIEGNEKINRMKIEYNLNGGTLTLVVTGSPSAKKTGIYTEYNSWKDGVDLNLLEIDNTKENAHHLENGLSPFAEWRTDLKDPDSKIEKTNDYKNLSVTAFYGSSVKGEVNMEEGKQDVELKDIKVTYGTATAPTNNDITFIKKDDEFVPNQTYTVPRMTGTPKEETNLKIVLDTEPGYKNVRFQLIRGENMTALPCDSSENTCTLKLLDYESEIIQVRVIADTKNAKGMSQTLIFNLQ